MTSNVTWTSSHADSPACPESWALLASLSGLLYYLAASLELALRGPDSTLPVLAPQQGVLVALLMTIGHRRWWPIAMAVLPAHLAAYWSTGLPWWRLSWQAAHDIVLAVSIGATLRVLLGQRNPFDSLRHFSLYLLTAVVAGPAILTLFAPSVALALMAGGPSLAIANWQAAAGASSLAMLTWGICIHVALLPGPGWLQQRTPLQYAEALLIAVALLALYYLTFVSAAEQHAALYLFFIPLLWQAVRFGVGAAAMAITLIATLAVASEHVPHSIRIREAPQAAGGDLQIFLMVMALTALVIAIVVEERRRVALAASASDARYRAIVESQTELVWRSLPDTTLTFVSESMCRYFGMTRQQLLGTRWLRFVPVEARYSLEQALARTTAQDPTFVLQHQVQLPDGRIVGWHEWVNTAIFSADQRLVEFQGAGRDITALEQAKQALRQSDERLSLILRAAYDVIYDWDIVRAEVWSSADRECSETVPRVRHCSLDSWGSCIDPADRERVVLDCRRALRSAAVTWEAEYLYAGHGGSPRWVRHRAYIVRDANGTAVRMIGALTDLSDRKNLEEANRTLERFARLAMVGQITASVAHEMNQPLGAIRYNAQAGLLLLAREHYDKDELREIFDDICRDNRRASEFIRRLRELLQDHELRLDPLNINDVIGDVVSLIRVESRRRHTQLETQCTDLPVVLGDYGRLQQVLLNLILNGMDAMATLPESRRLIAIRTARIGATRIHVEVVDRGCGIDPASLPKIFDSFFTSKDHGMGLGLAIARSIVEAHGGRIWAQNNADGIGATLAFEIDSLGSNVMLPAAGATIRSGARLN